MIFINSFNHSNNINLKFDIENKPDKDDLMKNFYQVFQMTMINKTIDFSDDWYSSILLKYMDNYIEDLNKIINSKTQIIKPIDENQSGEEFSKYHHYTEKVLEFPMMQHSNYIIQNKDFDFRIKQYRDIDQSDSEEDINEVIKPQRRIQQSRYINNHIKFPVVSKKYKFLNDIKRPNSKLDVYYKDNCQGLNILNKIKRIMDRIGEITQDQPIDFYQNIIDPNLLLDNTGKWISTTYYVQKYSLTKEHLQSMFKLFCSKCNKNQILSHSIFQIILDFMQFKDPFSIQDHQSNLNQTFKSYPIDTIHEQQFDNNILINWVYNKILNSALPMLTYLRKPALLLPGYLQVVPKAQRIYLRPEEEQDGVWHQDGNEEFIAAVVLYYYRNEGNQGGNLEFLQRTCSDFQINEDTCANITNLQNTKVECLEDRLIVFSNQEVVHRVLKMVNESYKTSQRDFIALFIVDQRRPLKSTSDLETNDELNTFWGLNNSKRYERRTEKFLGQLEPKKRFGVNSTQVHSTGNGTAAQLSFQYEENNLIQGSQYQKYLKNDVIFKKVMKVNKIPPVGRGLSQSNSTFHYTNSIEEDDSSDE